MAPLTSRRCKGCIGAMESRGSAFQVSEDLSLGSIATRKRKYGEAETLLQQAVEKVPEAD